MLYIINDRIYQWYVYGLIDYKEAQLLMMVQRLPIGPTKQYGTQSKNSIYSSDDFYLTDYHL